MTTHRLPAKHSRYSWKPDVADHRDRLMTVAKAVALPKYVNQIGLTNPIEDQSDLGSCTGNSTTSALEITLAKDMKLGGIALSRLFAYYNGRVIEGTVKQDAGCEIRDVVKGLFKTGVSSEKRWPYTISKFKTKPNAAAFAEAKSLSAALAGQYEYVRITTLAGIKAALAAGNPVVFGFSVPERFETMTSDYLLTYPTAKDAIIGGHAVVAVGYDDRPKKPFVWVRNSWGPSWGLNGYFKMTQDWFTNPERLADDIWMFRKTSA